MVKISWSFLQPFFYDTTIWRTDRWTDGQKDGRAIAYTHYSIYAVERKNSKAKSCNKSVDALPALTVPGCHTREAMSTFHHCRLVETGNSFALSKAFGNKENSPQYLRAVTKEFCPQPKLWISDWQSHAYQSVITMRRIHMRSTVGGVYSLRYSTDLC